MYSKRRSVACFLFVRAMAITVLVLLCIFALTSRSAYAAGRKITTINSYESCVRYNKRAHPQLKINCNKYKRKAKSPGVSKKRPARKKATRPAARSKARTRRKAPNPAGKVPNIALDSLIKGPIPVPAFNPRPRANYRPETLKISNYDPSHGLEPRDIEQFSELAREQAIKTERAKRTTFSPTGVANLELAKNVVNGLVAAGVGTAVAAGFAVTAPVSLSVGVFVLGTTAYVEYEKGRTYGKKDPEALSDALKETGKSFVTGKLAGTLAPGASGIGGMAAEDVSGNITKKLVGDFRDPTDNATPNPMKHSLTGKIEPTLNGFQGDRWHVLMRPPQ